jgi:hypothetical protein
VKRRSDSVNYSGKQRETVHATITDSFLDESHIFIVRVRLHPDCDETAPSHFQINFVVNRASNMVAAKPEILQFSKNVKRVQFL